MNTSYHLSDADILIDLANQRLYLPKHQKQYCISTGKNGIGEAENSGKTPRGWHHIQQKIGHEHALRSVFIGRQFTGEIYSAELAEAFPERDWILTRILWLSGLEPGFNTGEGCDTFNRYIYIHGTPDSEPMGTPMSHGCVRMQNEDIAELFDLVPESALVYLSEEPLCAPLF